MEGRRTEDKKSCLEHPSVESFSANMPLQSILEHEAWRTGLALFGTGTDRTLANRVRTQT